MSFREAELAALAARMGEQLLRQRLARERDAHLAPALPVGEVLAAHHLRGSGRAIHLVLTLCGLRGVGRRNAHAIELRQHALKLPRLPAAFEGFTLLHLSDLHIDAGERYLQALVERVQGVSCDACVLTGDFRFGTRGSSAPAIAALARLLPALPATTFAVLGNHDDLALGLGLEALGVRVLMNEAEALQRGGESMHIAGIDDAHYFRTHDLARARAGVPPDGCALLLSHTPQPYREAAAHGFAGMLCGHTHGGQICLPGGIPLLTEARAPRRLARGSWRFGTMAGYTSVGCGCSIVDARFFCPPEVTVHTLQRA
ncbi:metallophosphoesterase family protein [Ramlibacter ginsenosidimutans]|uniref:Metallophosphoesterase family protein n=1 Tax=Ramlibacter ginsenosidimutans TaxID=502333 RepID=A0A934WLI0_9BURK|nr:metallophosphoesterase [Ramlibacter ginsenosidimutans]MBK6005117.1 metallophosphoesterase family protein [Ramlibacter ginsenosidimutans]